MQVLSLFDGMSCLQIALKELNIGVDKYYASEIDKYAIKQTQHNFPDTIQLGSVTEWKSWDINWSKIDFIGAGSPCQGFSFAGKQLAFDDPRSKLFFVFIDILNHCKKHNPNVLFLLENVDMQKKHMAVICDYIGVFPVNINSSLVSAQNRTRWYWSNIKTRKEGFFDEVHSDITQPKDRGIILRDILENDVDEKYYLSNVMINWLNRHGDKRGTEIKIVNDNKKSACLTSSGLVKQNLSTDYICVAMRGRNPENPSDRKIGLSTEQRLEPKFDGKTNCLTSVKKDNLIMAKNYIQWDTSGKGYKSQQDRAFYDTGKHGTLSTTRAENKNGVFVNNRIRRLTPIECSRLQTIPGWYQWIVSDSQIYKLLGNGWTIEAIKHILSFMKNIY